MPQRTRDALRKAEGSAEGCSYQHRAAIKTAAAGLARVPEGAMPGGLGAAGRLGRKRGSRQRLASPAERLDARIPHEAARTDPRHLPK